MSLSEIPQKTKQKEDEIQKQINSSIDKFENIIFSAGAGAGKTYALIESLKYIIKNYSKILKYHNQKIICITYTNVASEEIRNRLGYSDLVKVSTIHERLWDLIKDYKKELLKIHIEKLEEELNNLQFDLYENQVDKIKKQFKVYRELNIEQKKSFKNTMLSNKDLFYDNYDKKAAPFRDLFKQILKPFSGILKNINKFKKTVNTIYRIDNYEKCLKKIKEEKENYKIVKYDSRFNSDILHKMIISHDTLLEYSLKMVCKYDLFKQIIVDSYPYILIDEYQDTNEKVVKIMNYLSDFAKDIQHRIFIGYFGDEAQNIYDDGVGDKIKEIHPGLKRITKIYNRRSHKEIIDVINKIRNDEVKQVSIYNDCEGGSVEFYRGDDTVKDNFINKYKKEWHITNDNKLHCLVLTNKLVSEFSGFINVYNYFYNTNYYKKNYDQINTELLSNDISKLGNIPNLFYNIIKFKRNVESPKTPLVNLIDKEIYSQLTFFDLKKIISIIKSLEGDSLGEYIKSIFNEYKETDNTYYKKIIRDLMNLEKYSYQGFLNKLINDLDEDTISDNKKTEDLLNINLPEYFRWYDFINEEYEGDVIFHTYHGTKGAEYNNVIIIMQNDFGRKGKNKFSSFFMNYNKTKAIEEKNKQKFNDTKNLIYVSCSRAIKNLRILYLDDISNFKKGIINIFGEVKEFSI